MTNDGDGAERLAAERGALELAALDLWERCMLAAIKADARADGNASALHLEVARHIERTTLATSKSLASGREFVARLLQRLP